MTDDTHYPRYCEPPAKRLTPETDAFFRTFADGQAAPSHSEYYDRMAQLERERDEAREQRDRLAEACKKLMVVVGPPNATIEQCWAGVDEIDEAWETGKAALAAVEADANVKSIP